MVLGMPAFTPTPTGAPDAVSGSRMRRGFRSPDSVTSPFPRRGRAARQDRSNRRIRFGKPGGRTVGTRPSSSAGLSGWLRGRRRLAIALLLSLAAGLAVHQLTPAPTHTVTVIAAARDLPVGATLATADLISLRIPPQLQAPGMFTEPPELAGKQLASPVLQGQIFATTQLLGQGLLTGAPKGFSAVPLRLADAASIRLLSPGQLVKIVKSSEAVGATGSETASEVLADAVAVLWTSGNGGQSSQWPGSGETEGLVVVAASPAEAGRLAGASSQGKLFFVLVGAGP